MVQQTLFSINKPIPISTSDYLRSVSVGEPHQPLCGDPEGWGPLSLTRWDFTPCFLDIWILLVSVVFGIILGLGAIYYLLREKAPASIPKNWHFYAKLSVIGALILTTGLQACLQIKAMPDVWFGDFRFWTTITSILGLLVIGVAQYYEHWRSRQPNAIVLFFWLFFLIASGVKLRSLVSQELYHEHLPYFIAFCISTGLALLEFFLEYVIPKKKSAYDALGDEFECPLEYADIFSVLTFGWMTPLMKYGYKQYLTQDDLWNLRRVDSTEVTGNIMEKSWKKELSKKSPSLWIAMFRGFGMGYISAGIIKTLSDALAFVQPQLLRLLITFVKSYDTPNPQPPIRGMAIALAMFTVSVSQTMCLHQYFQRVFEIGMRIRSSLTAMIYGKSLKLSNEGKASKSTGDIVNYMAVDTQRLQDLTQYGLQLWSAPLQITLCMISLYELVGYSMLAGVGIMLISIPMNGLLARYMKKLQKVQMGNKDARTRLMSEILNNMKSIKLYAWGQAFMKKLTYIRNDLELNTLRKIGAMSAGQIFAWNTTPVAVSTATFAVFVLTQDRPLSVDLVFPCLTLFNMLSFPLMVLPMVITAIIEATVAVGRLTSFFTAEELQSNAVSKESAAEDMGEESVVIQNASFTWDRNVGRQCLTNINLVARKGELSCIVGKVGSGKSSLLQAILGDIWKLEGEVTVKGSIAYAAQQPWVMNASVRENITFGHRWDPSFYQQTIEACALVDDFKILPDGDKTEVGERGISLSGGQKARLTLARAVYARADIYLLDDVLSAVDQHVGRHIINNVLGPNGLLATKTKILATNAITVLEQADYISHIKEGRISERGTYEQLVAMKGDVATVIRTANNDLGSGSSTPSQESPDDTSDESKTVYGTGAVSEEEREEELEMEEAQVMVGSIIPIQPGPPAGKGTRRQDFAELRRASTVSMKRPHGKLLDEENAIVRTKQLKEHSEQGKVKWSVYGEYAKASNLGAVAFYFVSLFISHTLVVASNLWLKDWTEANEKNGSNQNIGKFLGIYFGFGAGGSVLMALNMMVLWIFCSIEASRKLHERMAHAIFRSPMSFFETNPLGRILNRFSSDVYKVDEVLARTFNMLFQNTTRAAITLGLITGSTPWFALLIPPIGALYVYIQRYYLRTSRELKRLDSISKSPIFAHFQESLGGLTTIRAYRHQKRFQQENEWRVDANLRTYYPSISANRWLAVRLEFIGSLIILSAASFAITSVTTGTGLSAGMVGLVMAYTLQITQSLNWIVRQTVEVETNIVSVERCLEYAQLPSEAPEVLSKHRPKASWPSKGAVEFKDYSTRYRPELDLVLKDINLSFKSHEKIGVVGRTGAGKSSLTLALFRIVEPVSGHIAIDDLNTSTIGLLDVRRRLAIIPQDPALFEGTVRDNLDPGHVHDDTELWSVLTHARLREHISSMPGQLEAHINEGGVYSFLFVIPHLFQYRELWIRTSSFLAF